MNGISKILLSVGTGIGAYAFLMDTSVLSESGNRVYNFGRMQKQSMLLWTAGVAVVIGVVLLLKNRSEPEDTHPALSQGQAVLQAQYEKALRMIRADDAEGLRALLRQDNAVIKSEDDQRRTLLHHAAVAQSLGCVCALLKHGASPSRFDAAGKLPEDYAATEGTGVSIRSVLRAAG